MGAIRWYIDVGHGELINGRPDPGAVNGFLREHEMNINTANALASRLQQHGHIVKVEPGDLSIDRSAQAANQWGANYVISCHYNAGGGDRGEVLHSWDQAALPLAQAISIGLRNAGQTVVNIVRSKANKNGTAEYFGILRIPLCPAVIIEPCFLDNLRDREIADTAAEQQKIGFCIADSIGIAYGSILNVNYIEALKKLTARKIITSPDYWASLVVSTNMAKGEYLGIIMQKVTGKPDAVSAINYLGSIGVINSPAYWVANCNPGHEVVGYYVQALIIGMVTKLKL